MQWITYDIQITYPYSTYRDIYTRFILTMYGIIQARDFFIYIT